MEHTTDVPGRLQFSVEFLEGPRATKRFTDPVKANGGEAKCGAGSAAFSVRRRGAFLKKLGQARSESQGDFGATECSLAAWTILSNSALPPK